LFDGKGNLFGFVNQCTLDGRLKQLTLVSDRCYMVCFVTSISREQEQ